jgi:hypothetical protein
MWKSVRLLLAGNVGENGQLFGKSSQIPFFRIMTGKSLSVKKVWKQEIPTSLYDENNSAVFRYLFDFLFH